MQKTTPQSLVIANGQTVAAKLPCTIQEFLVAEGLLPRSVVVEHALARPMEWD